MRADRARTWHLSLTALSVSLVLVSSVSVFHIAHAQSKAMPALSIETTLKQATWFVKHHQVDRAENLLETVAKTQHSGQAYFMLAPLQAVHQPYVAIQSYLQAARFGYPQAYQSIAQLYHAGHTEIKADPLLAACYENLAALQVDDNFVQRCDEKRPGTFIHYPNEGIQSAEEARRFVQTERHALCEGQASRLINPALHAITLNQLREQWCQAFTHHALGFLKNGDLVLNQGKVFQYESGEQLPYRNALTDGTVVYQQQPAYEAFVYQDGHFIPAPDGTRITDADGKQQYIVKQHLEPIAEPLS